MNGFDKELYVATVATATIIINYANDVAIVWDQLLQDYLAFYNCLRHSERTNYETTNKSTQKYNKLKNYHNKITLLSNNIYQFKYV